MLISADETTGQPSNKPNEWMNEFQFWPKIEVIV